MVKAVLGNRSLAVKFPASREKSREFFNFGAKWRKTVSEISVFSAVMVKFPKNLSREIYSLDQGMVLDL